MRHLVLALMLIVLSAMGPAWAGTLRVAVWDVGLSRDGPGLLLAELAKEPGPQAAAAVAVIQAVRPDVLLLVRFDHDRRGAALAAFRDRLAEGAEAITYPHLFTGPVNAGVPSDLDLDGDGRRMGPGDAWGWGRFPGQGGMAILSRHPLDAGAARSFAALPWRALPGARLPVGADGAPYPDAEAQGLLRLSSRAHWDVPVLLPDGGRLHLLASNPTPPLFDGPERLNQLRNADEVRFWSTWLGGAALADDSGDASPRADGAFVLLGDLNLDPFDGRGDRGAIAALLADPRLQDPAPVSAGAALAAANGHQGDPARDTADFDEAKAGNLRLDYVLPSAGLAVAGAGVFWPAPGEPLAEAVAAASAHRLVWVDLALPPL